MANTTWKQVVLDTADAYREANGTTDKIPVGQLADKVRAGAGTPYEGDNPLTIGQAGFTFPAKTLLKDGLQIINGVNGEDLTDTADVQQSAVKNLLRMVSRKIAENKGEGEYVWKKYKIVTLENPSIVINGPTSGAKVTSSVVDLSKVDASFFDGFVRADNSEMDFRYKDGTLYYYYKGDVYDSIIWNPKTQIIAMSTKSSEWTNNTFNYTGTKEVKLSEGFSVSSDAEAYPNGGEQDGCWYDLLSQPVDLADETDLIAENIREGVDIFGIIGAMSEGVSGIDFGEITPSSTQMRFTIPHKLNKTPKYAIIICSTWESDGRIVAIDSANGFTLGTSISKNQKLTLSSTTISGNPIVAGLQGGVKHYWFAIA